MNLRRKLCFHERGRQRSLAAHCAITAPRTPQLLLDKEETSVNVKTLAGNVRSRIAVLVKWNKVLRSRLRAQIEQLERMNRLRKLLSPQVAEVIISCDEESMRSYRREIAALFCDLRGFTAFSDNASPEAVMDVLRLYHQAMGTLIDQFGGTIEHRAGDGIMVIFNAPLPCQDPALQAVRLAVAMRGRMRELTRQWRTLGFQLGFGVGVSLGYATLGMVGSEGRLDYVANGRAVNLASRLSDEAADGQILVSERAYDALKGRLETEYIGELTLKGFRQRVKAFGVAGVDHSDASSCRFQSDQARSHDKQKSPGRLNWSQWLSEDEIRHY